MGLRDQFERIDRALANIVYPEPKGPEEEPMPLVIKEDAGQQFEVAPPGLHRAVCADVIDLGVKETDYGPKRKVKFVFQLAAKNKKGERFQARCEHTQSLFEGANLRKMLESWRGRTFSEQERRGFDVETVLNVNCQLALQQAISKSTGRTYAKITAVLPADKTQPALVVENYTREVWASEKTAQAHAAGKAKAMAERDEREFQEALKAEQAAADSAQDFTATDDDVPF